jgi:SAM-dependent methyltransferase
VTATPCLNEYATAEHALKYLARADRIPHRTEGESVLLELVPRNVQRILDLGTGDGRLLALLRLDRHDAHGVALDFSPTMLEAARTRFRDDHHIQVVEHNLDERFRISAGSTRLFQVSPSIIAPMTASERFIPKSTPPWFQAVSSAISSM